MKRKKVTEHDKSIIELYYAVKTAKWISDKIGCCPDAVYKNAQKLGLQKRPHIYKGEESRQNIRYKKRYGYGLEKWKEMFKEQGGKCAICGRHQDDLNVRLHFDHDHETGLPRGLLCSQCNPGLGCFDDSIVKLELAIKYLRTAREGK